jgi:alanine dehydrogenase
MKIAQLGAKQAILSDDGTAEGVNTFAGSLTYQAVAQSQGKEYKAIRTLLA